MFQKCVRIIYSNLVSQRHLVCPSRSSRIITGSGWSTTFDIRREISRTILIPRIEEAKRVPFPVISGSRPQGETSKISFSTVTNQRCLWNISPSLPFPRTGRKHDSRWYHQTEKRYGGKRFFLCDRDWKEMVGKKRKREREKRERVSLKGVSERLADSLVFSLVREMARKRKMDECY